MKHWGDEVAAVLVEPIVGNFGMVEPQPGFLEKVNEITHDYGALVIYDEVITAFLPLWCSPRSIKCIPRLNCIRKNNWRWPLEAMVADKIWNTLPRGSGIAGTIGNPLSMRQVSHY